MFVHIQTLFLNTSIYPQAMQLLDAIEKDNTTDRSPKVNHKDTKHLCPKESPSKTIASTIGG